jgi:hypothetical protein
MRDKNLTVNTRIESLDVLRGFALMLIILFHSSIYNYANIHKIDFSNPPIIVVLMSFMALWGGIFIICSMVVNSYMLLVRSRNGVDIKTFLFPVAAGFLYILLHYLLNIFLGRWNNDFVYNRPDMTVVAGSLRNMHFTFPHINKFFEGSSLSTIAFNLIIVSFILYLLIRRKGIGNELRNYLILGISGFLIMILSFVRVPLFHIFSDAVESRDYFAAFLLSFSLANPYPLLPYLAYGLFGTMTGLMIFLGRRNLVKSIIIPAGFLFLIFGFYGMTKFDKSISTPDYFWYFKTNFELGVFLLMVAFTYLGVKDGSFMLRNLRVIRWFSRISLTIYLLETTTSELMRIFCLLIWPSWNQTINGCLTFGGLNIILWIFILFLWRKIDFKYSLEYFWVKLFAKTGKNSTKMELLP